MAVRALDADGIREHRKALGRILVDCVEAGAAIGFVLPFGLREAMDYWDEVATQVDARRYKLLVNHSRDHGLVGAIQVTLKMPASEAHRAELMKLMVAPEHRGMGAGSALLRRAEVEAALHGRTLLSVEVAAGSDAERLCVRHGWRPGGVIPGYSSYPDGTFCDTIFFWKAI